MDSFWKEWAHFFLGPLPASFTSLSPKVVTREGFTVKEKVYPISPNHGLLHIILD